MKTLVALLLLVAACGTSIDVQCPGTLKWRDVGPYGDGSVRRECWCRSEPASDFIFLIGPDGNALSGDDLVLQCWNAYRARGCVMTDTELETFCTP